MLEFTIVQAPFRFGIEEGIDPKQVPPGTLLSAKNVVWNKTGRVQKRKGTDTAIPLSALKQDGTTEAMVGTARRLMRRGNELCMVFNDNLYSAQGLSNPTGWLEIDMVPNVGLTWSTAIDTSLGISAIDSERTDDVTVTAWITGDPTTNQTGALYVQVKETDTDHVLIASRKLSASANYKVRVLLMTDGTFVVLTCNGANIVAYRLVPGSQYVPTSSSNLVTGAGGGSSAGYFDAVSLGSTFVVAYVETATGDVRVRSFNSSLALQAGPVTVEALGATNGWGHISIDGRAGGKLFVAYGELAGGTPMTAHCASHHDSTLVQEKSPFSYHQMINGEEFVQVGVTWVDSTHGVLSCSGKDGASSTHTKTRHYEILSGATTLISEHITWGVEMVCRPFLLGARVYAPVAETVPQDETLGPNNKFTGSNKLLLEFEVAATNTAVPGYPSGFPNRYVGRIDHLIGGVASHGAVAKATIVSSTEAEFVTPFLSAVPTSLRSWRQGARRVRATISDGVHPDMWRGLSYGQELYIAAGLLAAHDGRSVFDYCFSRAPRFVSLTASGGNLVAGSYIYGAHQEYQSAAGVRHRGPVGQALVTFAANSNVAIVADMVNVSLKQDSTTGAATYASLSTNLPIYRSVKDGDALYRLTVEPVYNTIVVSPGSAEQTLSDTVTDANIGDGTRLNTRPGVYTAGDIKDDAQPPAPYTMMLHKSRLWVIDGSRREVWFSKSFQDDIGVAPGFSPDFRLVFDEDLTALGGIDDKHIFFSLYGIWALSGDGPAPNGANNDFGTPVRLQTDVGCKTARSVVSVPDGLMFEAARGIYLLTRGLELVWIGRPIQDLLQTYTECTSAVLVPDHNQVRFSFNNADGDEGVVVVYDYVEKAWTHFEYADGVTARTPIADACLHNNAYTFVVPAGRVYREATAHSLDGGAAGSWVSMAIETAWWHAEGPLAYQSVRNFRLDGISVSNHDLSVSIGFDGSTSYQEGPRTWLAGTPVTAVGPIEHGNVSIGTRRKCRSIRFKIEDATPTNPGTYPVGTGEGAILDMMGIEVGRKKGLGAIPATQRR